MTGRAERLRLDPDRFFDPEPGVRRTARALYDELRLLPLVCPHGHVDQTAFATNAPYPEPTALIVIPDHYIFRMLYSQGVSLESLGIPARDGTPVERDPRRIWQLFAANYHLFRGTPTGIWLDHELHEVFGVRHRLNASTGPQIYDEIAERLASPDSRPRALYERFNIEVLVTTDAATDTLEHHRTIRDSGWRGRVLPTFRPDALLRIAVPGWTGHLEALGRSVGRAVSSVDGFLSALAERRAFFKSMGATCTDHAVVDPYTERLPAREIEEVFQRAIAGKATPADQRKFEAHMLIEMARMSAEDGLVMQLHAGSFRGHNTAVDARFGPDKGGDIPVTSEFTRNMHALLNAHGNDPRLTLILFTLDESTYARELAPIAGHYPAVRLGPPWWFHDSIQGMRRFRERTTETAGIYNTVGFNDDTRAFCSIPARHDVARRMDANFLAGLVARHIISMDDARDMGRALTYDLVRKAYKLDGAPGASSATARNGKPTRAGVRG